MVLFNRDKCIIQLWVRKHYRNQGWSKQRGRSPIKGLGVRGCIALVFQFCSDVEADHHFSSFALHIRVILEHMKLDSLPQKVSQKVCFRWTQMHSAASGHTGCIARLKLVQGGNVTCGWCANHKLSTRCCTPHLGPCCHTPLVKALISLMHHKLTIGSAVLWMRPMWQQDYVWTVRQPKQSFAIW